MSGERRRGGSPEDRLAVWAPPLYRWLCAALWLPVARLPPRSRVRRALIERTCARAYAAFNARDLPVFLSMFDPEVVYDVSQVRDWLDQPMFSAASARWRSTGTRAGSSRSSCASCTTSAMTAASS